MSFGVSAGLPPTVSWTGEAVRIIDQRELPHRLVTLDLRTCEDVAHAIRDMAVRGAPAIGCTAALGLALAARSASHLQGSEARETIDKAAVALKASRPTAVNLFWAVDRVLGVIEGKEGQQAADAALNEALRMLDEDLQVNRAIGRHGLEVLPADCTVLTHCNAGALATVGYGTALGVVRAGFAAGKVRHVYVDETRPRLQGMQLTAWELRQEGIPVTVLPDGAAAWLMRSKRVDLVVVGADRIAANGDTANKIGTYGLAVNARRHNVPFFVAAPTSTVDWGLPNGDCIPIEERSADEVTHIAGVRVAPENVAVWNPAFDVTPAELIRGIITEFGVAEATAAGLALIRRKAEGGLNGRA